MSNMVRAISEMGGVMMIAMDSTQILQEMEAVHHPSAVSSAALGRLLTAGSMMGTLLKGEKETLTLNVNGGGPIGSLVVVADSEGNVRGYADNPFVELPPRPDGKLDVGGAVGREGTLTVIRDSGSGEPYNGTVPLASGEIAEDITAYYAHSEQTPTVCALGVLVNKDLTIHCGGGFLLQCLPGAIEEDIAIVEENLRTMPSVTQLLKDGGTPKTMIDHLLKGLDPQILDEQDTRYKCRCSREKTHDLLLSLGKQELENLQKEEKQAEVRCHFCNTLYHFDLDELLQEIN